MIFQTAFLSLYSEERCASLFFFHSVRFIAVARVKEILRGMVNDGMLSAVGEKKRRRYVKKQ